MTDLEAVIKFCEEKMLENEERNTFTEKFELINPDKYFAFDEVKKFCEEKIKTNEIQETKAN